MKIITVPNENLRVQASKIEVLDKKVLQLLRELGETLSTQRNPKGVGLAAPQVAVTKQVFATLLPQNENGEAGPEKLRWYLNPTLTDFSETLTFGPNPEDPFLEGCLSIPGLYGPVPRHEWIELTFQEVAGTGASAELLERTERFTGFAARVIQHEHDHLLGKLFTDYSLEFDLPVYQENKRSEKLEEVDKRILEGW